MMETLHYILIALQLIVIVLLLTFSLQMYVGNKKEKMNREMVEEYEEW